MAVDNHVSPKVLFITGANILEDNISYTYTIRSFIGALNKDSIYQVVCKDDASGISGMIGTRTFQLNHKDILLGKYYNRKELSSQGFAHGELTQRNQGIIKKIQNGLRHYAKTLYSILPYRISVELNDFIIKSKIDVIYTCTASPRSYKLIFTLSQKYHIPVIPHILDDWPNILFEGAPLLSPIKRRFLTKFENLIRKSHTVFTACDLMSEGYSKRYGTQNFISLMHCVPELSLVKSSNYRNPIKIIYGGSLYLDRDIIIAQLSNKMQEMGVADAFEIDIYSSKLQWEGLKTSFESCTNVYYKGSVSQEEMFKIIIDDADILLLPESFDEESLKYIRYSMSTKIPEYLSSGHPILAIGNKEQGSINYLMKNDAAYVIAQYEDYFPVITNIMTGKNKEQILANARNIFVNNHEQSSQERKFINAINVCMRNVV